MLYKLTRIQKCKHSNNVPMHCHQNLLCRSYFSVKSPSERFSKLNHLLIGSDSTLVKGELFNPTDSFSPILANPSTNSTGVLVTWNRVKVFNPQNPKTLFCPIVALSWESLSYASLCEGKHQLTTISIIRSIWAVMQGWRNLSRGSK